MYLSHATPASFAAHDDAIEIGRGNPREPVHPIAPDSGQQVHDVQPLFRLEEYCGRFCRSRIEAFGDPSYAVGSVARGVGNVFGFVTRPLGAAFRWLFTGGGASVGFR